MRVKFRGAVTNARTAKMLAEAERIYGAKIVIVQGSYRGGATSASAGTHDGGGVVDLSVRGLTRPQINRLVRALRTVGFAAWFRSEIPGLWGAHIHAVAIGTRDLAPVAARQVTAYRHGRNGLANAALDRHRNMNIPVRTWEQYKRQRDRARRPSATRP